MLSIKNVHASVEGKEILKNIDFTFEEGKSYAMMGPNGSGKSTMANTIMGHPAYEVSEDSELLLEGEDIKEMEANERA